MTARYCIFTPRGGQSRAEPWRPEWVPDCLTVCRKCIDDLFLPPPPGPGQLFPLLACTAQAADDSDAVKKPSPSSFERKVLSVAPTSMKGVYEVVMPGW